MNEIVNRTYDMKNFSYCDFFHTADDSGPKLFGPMSNLWATHGTK